MGNCSGRITGGSSIKLIGPEGDLKLVSAPVTAAELMLDAPGYAVAPLEGLRLTRRLAAVKADDELESGKAYFMVQVGRVGSKVSDHQLAAIERVASGGAVKKQRRKGGSKVLPENLAGGDVGGSRRCGNTRPWSPVLESISEA